MQAPEEVPGWSQAELGSSMGSLALSDLELLELVDPQQALKLLSQQARQGMCHVICKH